MLLDGFLFRWKKHPHRFGEAVFCASPPRWGHAHHVAPAWAPAGVPEAAPRASLPTFAASIVEEWRQSGALTRVLPGNVPDESECTALRVQRPARAVPLPAITVCGIGAREVVDGDDRLVDPPTLHTARLPLASIGVDAATIADCGVALDGFHLRAIAWKTRGAASADHPLRTWTRQGTHLRALRVLAGAPYVEGSDLVIPLDVGVIGGHAAAGDPAQRWEGAHGYVGAVHLVLLPAEDGATCTVSLPVQAGATYGYRKLGRGDVVSSGFVVHVTPHGPSADAPDMGRLIREMGAGLQRFPDGSVRFFTGFSNQGAWALPHQVTGTGALLQVPKPGVT